MRRTDAFRFWLTGLFLPFIESLLRLISILLPTEHPLRLWNNLKPSNMPTAVTDLPVGPPRTNPDHGKSILLILLGPHLASSRWARLTSEQRSIST